MSQDRPAPPLRYLVYAERLAAVLLLLVVLGLMTAQVTSRFLGAPLAWSEEVARFAFIWLAFVSAAFVAGEGRHLAVDLAAPLVGRRGRVILELVGAAVVVTACAMLLHPQALSFIAGMAAVRSPSADIPMALWYLAGGVGVGLIALHAAAGAVYALARGAPLWAAAEADVQDGTDDAGTAP